MAGNAEITSSGTAMHSGTATATRPARRRARADHPATAPARKARTAEAPKAPAAKKAANNLKGLKYKADETPWTQEEVDEVLLDLNDHHQRITGLIRVLERDVHGLMTNSGDGAGQDQADVGSATMERDQELQLMADERVNLELVEAAMERIAAGTYGACDSCEEPIGKLRLMAFPRATLCMPCKQREERR